MRIRRRLDHLLGHGESRYKLLRKRRLIKPDERYHGKVQNEGGMEKSKKDLEEVSHKRGEGAKRRTIGMKQGRVELHLRYTHRSVSMSNVLAIVP